MDKKKKDEVYLRPEEDMGEVSKKKFEEILRYFRKEGIDFSRLDFTLLRLFSEAYERYYLAYTEWKNCFGAFSSLSPETQVAAKCCLKAINDNSLLMSKLIQEFGLSPKSRKQLLSIGFSAEKEEKKAKSINELNDDEKVAGFFKQMENSSKA